MFENSHAAEIHAFHAVEVRSRIYWDQPTSYYGLSCGRVEDGRLLCKEH